MREPRGKVLVGAIASPRSRYLRSLSWPPITPTLRAHLRPDNGSAGFPHADYKGPSGQHARLTLQVKVVGRVVAGLTDCLTNCYPEVL